MGKILGIDYGRRKVGFAFASGSLAEPIEVFGYSEERLLFHRIENLTHKFSVDTIVIGVSEGAMLEETLAFGDKVKERMQMPVFYQDETLSSLDAQRLAIDSGKKRKRRREMEDAYAAALILQNYLDSHIKKGILNSR